MMLTCNLSIHPDLIVDRVFVPNLDVQYGLRHALYVLPGYGLRWLVFASDSFALPGPELGWIVDVSKMDDPAILRLIRHGYFLAVLERADEFAK